jgi:L-fuconolactonase
VIDAHQHFWCYSDHDYPWINASMHHLKQDFLPSLLYRLFNRVGIQGSIAVQARQSIEETRWLIQLSRQNQFIRGVVGWIDLQADVSDQLQLLAGSDSLVGVRHVIQDEPDDRFMLKNAFLKGISQLSAGDLVYEILIYPRHLPYAVHFVRQFPDQVFVLDHLAKPFIRQGVLEPWRKGLIDLARFPNVFCKISGMVTEADWHQWQSEQFFPYLDAAFECFGPDRLMFGSDWPVCTLAASYEQVFHLPLSYMQDKGYTDGDIRKVFGENAARIYSLDRRKSKSRIES